LSREFKGQGLEVLGINLEEDPEAVLGFQKEFAIPFRLFLDRDGQIQKLMGVRGHPSNVLIDRKGRIVGRILGERDWQSEAARRLVRSLLDERE